MVQPASMPPGRSKFKTEMQVRPDDIDMNQHVHASRYMDYVLAARYDQMARCYKMPMEEFIAAGLGWYVRVAHVEFKRPLALGDLIVVETWIDEFFKDGVVVKFEIVRKATNKLACDGYFHYTMVSLKTGRAEAIPESIAQRYSI